MKKVTLPDFLVKRFRYHYSNDTMMLFQPKGQKQLLKKSESYWVAEKHRIVDELIQYALDIEYKVKKPKWIEADKMQEDCARYSIEVVNKIETNLQKLDKKQAIKLGVSPEHLRCRFDKEEKPKEFKKSLEVWRLKHCWESLYDEKWDDDPAISVFEFKLKKMKAKYPNYIDIHWVEKVK